MAPAPLIREPMRSPPSFSDALPGSLDHRPDPSPQDQCGKGPPQNKRFLGFTRQSPGRLEQPFDNSAVFDGWSLRASWGARAIAQCRGTLEKIQGHKVGQYFIFSRSAVKKSDDFSNRPSGPRPACVGVRAVRRGGSWCFLIIWKPGANGWRRPSRLIRQGRETVHRRPVRRRAVTVRGCRRPAGSRSSNRWPDL